MVPSRTDHKTSRAEDETEAIRGNRIGHDALSQAARDLADLLVDVALRRLENNRQPHPEWPGDTP